jgi:hypothetical protein
MASSCLLRLRTILPEHSARDDSVTAWFTTLSQSGPFTYAAGEALRGATAQHGQERVRLRSRERWHPECWTLLLVALPATSVFSRMLGEIEQLGLARPQSERHQLPVAVADGATERLHIDQNVVVRRGLVVSLAVE